MGRRGFRRGGPEPAGRRAEVGGRGLPGRTPHGRRWTHRLLERRNGVLPNVYMSEKLLRVLCCNQPTEDFAVIKKTSFEEEC